MTKRIFVSSLLLLCAAVLFCGCSGGAAAGKSEEDVISKGFVAGASVHDPSIIADDGRYYIFGSHMEAAFSDDLRTWSSFASGVNSGNKLFSNLFDPGSGAFSYVGKNSDGGYSVWAPDVVYNKAMGKYVMYFCTTSSYIKSSLCFAVSDSITGPYEYVDTFLYSGFTKDTLSETNFYDFMPADTEIKDYLTTPSKYNNQVWPNCIDPSVFYDADGKMWMVYGSWSGGIFLLEIDEQTGYPVHPKADSDNGVDTYFGKRLIGGFHNSIEGPYILYDEGTGYYYLFVSYGSLTSDGGYQIRVLRSDKVEGPYEDAAGQEMGMAPGHTKYGVKLMGNYELPSTPRAYMSPGHCSAFRDSDGKLYVVYHTRFDDGSEYHEPRVHQLFVTENGWLAAAPFAAGGETLSGTGYGLKDLKGRWYVVDHGLDISQKINSCEEIVIKSDGKAEGDETFELQPVEGTNYVTVMSGGAAYSGVIIDMTDEAGNDVRCITAVGENNQCIWCVMYL